MSSISLEKFPHLRPAVAGLALLLAALSAQLAGANQSPAASSDSKDSPVPEVSNTDPTATHWQCRNNLEVSCSEGKCEAETGDGFTPMRVSIADSGVMSVCAYSGCWEGTGTMLKSGQFLVLVGHDLKFSTAQETESTQENIAIVLDRSDGVATLKAGAFAQPLLCERSKGTP